MKVQSMSVIRLPIARAFRRAALPLAWYYAVTLALPLVNGAAEAGGAFLEHAFFVLIVPPTLVVLACAVYEAVRVLSSSCGR
jgi:hypothetical protein